MTSTVPLIGHQLCPCGTWVVDAVAYKTGGLCDVCHRERVDEVIGAALVVVDGRERIVLRTDRSRRKPAEAAKRAKARKAKRQESDERQHRQAVTACAERARRRLQRLFPELWEVLLADERAKAGLNAWTIDRALTPGEASSSLEALKAYHHLT